MMTRTPPATKIVSKVCGIAIGTDPSPRYLMMTRIPLHYSVAIGTDPPME